VELYGNTGNNRPQITVIVITELLILAAAFWVLFGGGYNALFHTQSAGNFSRHVVLFAFNLVVFFRILITFTVFLKRHMPWAEAFNIPFAFGLYYVGYALLGYKSEAAFDWMDILGILLFIKGSYLNTFSEWRRHIWKKDPANKGKLYTGGLFKYSMHINFFGDLLWVTGYALVCHNPYAFIIVAFIFVFFAFYNIPKLDKYLAAKYGDDFAAYAKTTKKFIPFVY
jgi:protein-S-isoprenylcysteine O-methyltransferase Ste14